MLFNRWCARESVKRGSLFLGACWCCIMISHVLILEKETGEKKMKPVSTLAFPSLPACSPRRRFVSLLTHLSLSCVLQASGVYLKKKKKAARTQWCERQRGHLPCLVESGPCHYHCCYPLPLLPQAHKHTYKRAGWCARDLPGVALLFFFFLFFLLRTFGFARCSAALQCGALACAFPTPRSSRAR